MVDIVMRIVQARAKFFSNESGTPTKSVTPELMKSVNREDGSIISSYRE